MTCGEVRVTNPPEREGFFINKNLKILELNLESIVTVIAIKKSKHFWEFDDSGLPAFYKGANFLLDDYYKIKTHRESSINSRIEIKLGLKKFDNFDVKWNQIKRKGEYTEYYDPNLKKRVEVCDWVQLKFEIKFIMPRELFLKFTPLEDFV